MKKSVIVAVIVIAVAIGIIVSSTGGTSSYVNFEKAKEMASKGEDEKVHVVGKLKKNAQGKIENIFYNPLVDPNYFEFQLFDLNNQTMRVIYGSPKPADFERSEQIVIIGSVKENVFYASKILMKCPSKYAEKEIKPQS